MKGVRRLVSAMTHALRHRGPDDEGLWCDEAAGICLGHRRLSIIDLSPTGHQPMISACGNYVITFNGEIYNFRELAKDLERAGRMLRGTSDTEVLLEACAAWGVEAAIRRCDGMFAFALWSRRDRTITLVRDRMGKKPLYWATVGGRLFFASELNALKHVAEIDRKISNEAFGSYLTLGYVPSPVSIITGVNKLLPGTLVRFSEGRKVSELRYWSLDAIAGTLCRQAPPPNRQEADAELEKLLRESVAHRMIADVPVGILLSGGVDSSLIAAIMREEASAPVRSFCLSFDGGEYDEGQFARRVAEILGTEHVEFKLSGEDVLNSAERITEWFDEPLADNSVLPTALISMKARSHVTVALSGDGGDEMFAGYSRYPWTDRIWRNLRRYPMPFRRLAGALMAGIPSGTWGIAGRVGDGLALGERIGRYAELVDAPDIDELYRRVTAYWLCPSEVLRQQATPVGRAEPPPSLGDPILRMQCCDARRFLPDDILAKVDRASMAFGLEVRSPLLDHKVVEFAFGMPRHYHLSDGRGKMPLRRLLGRYLPEALIDRQKRGFSSPTGDWLRGPLREWGRATLDHLMANEPALFCRSAIARVWKEHQGGLRNHQNRLWSLLMFEVWREKYGASF